MWSGAESAPRACSFGVGGPQSAMWPTTLSELDAIGGFAGRRRLNGLASEYGRQQAPGQLPTSNVPKSHALVTLGPRGEGAGASGCGVPGSTALVRASSRTRT